MSAAVQDKLHDVTTCCICDEIYKEPMILPCVHTFCLTCLQHIGAHTKSKSGDAMPCPLCREEFIIPKDGFAALKKNFFMLKLIEITTTPQVSSTEDVCDIHENENLCLYCFKCHEVLCMVCLRESHQNHQMWDLSSVAKKLRVELERNVGTVKHWISDAFKKKEGLLKTKSASIKEIRGINAEVNQMRQDLKALIDQHADSLLQNLDLLGKEMIQKIEIEEKELEKYMDCLQNCEMSSAELDSEDHHDSLFCKKANELKEQIDKLELMNKSISAYKLHSFPIDFTTTVPSAMEIFKKENIIGIVKRNADYAEKPELITAIDASSAATLHDDITGMAVYYNEVFISYGKNPVVSIYDAYTHECKRQLTIEHLVNGVLLANCVSVDGNVYIANRLTDEILRIDQNQDFMKWPTKDECRSISVSAESTIIVTGQWASGLQEYLPQGTLLREIELDSAISDPLHAIKLRNGHFAVSHFDPSCGGFSQVCIISTTGAEIRSFPGMSSSIPQLYYPNCLAEDEDGNILVLDRDRSCVLLFSPELEFVRELLTRADGLRWPVAMHLEEKTGRLYIADNHWNQPRFKNSKVLIFNIK